MQLPSKREGTPKKNQAFTYQLASDHPKPLQRRGFQTFVSLENHQTYQRIESLLSFGEEI